MDHSTEIPRQRSIDDTSFTSVAMSSPATSVFSKGHMSKSSVSSLSTASSPNLRESIDLFGPKLGKVAEEQEREELAKEQDFARRPSLSNVYSLYFASETHDSSASGGIQPEYTLSESNYHGAFSLVDQYHGQRQSSTDNAGQSLHRRLSSRFGSMSRRLKNRSGAGPQLSIITHMSAPPSRAGSTSSAPIISPAMSAISQHRSYLPPSPAQERMDGSMHRSFLDEDEDNEMEDNHQADQPQATTPLLPPVFPEHLLDDAPMQSPLQSPSIAPTPTCPGSRPPSDKTQLRSVAGLPSPPLSTKPSMVSIQQRSRANTATAPLAEIPSLQLAGQDPWSHALGHANFNIHPEPYIPEIFDLESYAEFRSNWEAARRNYAKHLARTSEHYGSTSKVFRLTVEKWTSIDSAWKNCHNALEKAVEPQLAEVKRISDKMSDDSQQVRVPLEKPASRIVMPEIDDKCGKFPELGDGDIVGPMEVAPPRSADMSPSWGPTTPRKRSLFRFLSDMLGKA